MTLREMAAHVRIEVFFCYGFKPFLRRVDLIESFLLNRNERREKKVLLYLFCKALVAYALYWLVFLNINLFTNVCHVFESLHRRHSHTHAYSHQNGGENLPFHCLYKSMKNNKASCMLQNGFLFASAKVSWFSWPNRLYGCKMLLETDKVTECQTSCCG